MHLPHTKIFLWWKSELWYIVAYEAIPLKVLILQNLDIALEVADIAEEVADIVEEVADSAQEMVNSCSS